MKTYRLRGVGIAVNLCAGIIATLTVAAGIRLLTGNAASWRALLGMGIGCALLMLLANAIWLSGWVLPAFQRFKSLLASAEPLRGAAAQFRLREFHDAAAELTAQKEELAALIRVGQESIEQNAAREWPKHARPPQLETFARRVGGMVADIKQYVEEIAQGRLFANVPNSLRHTALDEPLQKMAAELRDSLLKVRKELRNLSQTAAKVEAMSQQSDRNAAFETHAIESISGSSVQVAANLRDIMQDIRQQGESVANTFADVTNMIASIERIDANAELLSSSADATARSIREIHEFMEEIERNAQQLAAIFATVSREAADGLHAVDVVRQGICAIQDAVQDAASTIRILGEESDRIGEILEVIDSVVEQTNLLSLNASIIAAQAGEHGRGFAVVAGEIRELADRTKLSTKEIDGIIHSLQTQVEQGSVAIQRALQTVERGVTLSDQSGVILQKIVASIQDAQSMVSTLAEATVTQTQNSLAVAQATERITEKIEDLYATAATQANDSAHLAEMIDLLKQITEHIDRSALQQLHETESIVREIHRIQGIAKRNAKMTHDLAESSGVIGVVENNLAETMGQFFVEEHTLPSTFDARRPTIIFVRNSGVLFFDYIAQGVREALVGQPYQYVEYNCQNDSVMQVDYINWLLQQPWLRGIVLAPVNEHLGVRLVAHILKQRCPLVCVDLPMNSSSLEVVSDHECGGVYAAEFLRQDLPESDVTAIIFGSRDMNSIARRMDGFCKTTKSYGWQIVEFHASVVDADIAKKNILDGLELTPEASAIFLTAEPVVAAFLDLREEGKLPPQLLAHAVGFDISPRMVAAIQKGLLNATIIQDPAQLGKTATQHLLDALKRPDPLAALPAKELRIDVQKVTRDNVATVRA